MYMEQEKTLPPMVFVSHASEDKDRFVIAFATTLRDNGINAWVDKWEICPGDSLVDKIFEIGIGAAQAILIVLSRNSVAKPWVRQELDASVVERIKRGTKIIPIVLDDCVVPVSLQSTLYVRIADLNDYDAELKSIIDAIYEYSHKPPLGSPPSYVQTTLERIPGLKRIDGVLLKLAGNQAVENGHRFGIGTEEMLEKAASQGISRYNFYDSLAVLGDKHYFELNTVVGGEPHEPELKRLTRGGVPSFSITIYGFEHYANAYIPDYQSIIRGVLLQIVNDDKSDSAAIASALNQPRRIIEHVFDLLNQRGQLRTLQEHGLETTHSRDSRRLNRPTMVYCAKKSSWGGTSMELTEEIKGLLLKTAKDRKRQRAPHIHGADSGSLRRRWPEAS
jgi:hypothetical protein